MTGDSLHFIEPLFEWYHPYLFHSHVIPIFHLPTSISLKLVRCPVRTNSLFSTLSPLSPSHKYSPSLHQILPSQIHTTQLNTSFPTQSVINVDISISHSKIPQTLVSPTFRPNSPYNHPNQQITFNQTSLKTQIKTSLKSI